MTTKLNNGPHICNTRLRNKQRPAWLSAWGFEKVVVLAGALATKVPNNEKGNRMVKAGCWLVCIFAAWKNW
jgi:hypothetical protein